jgi:uncharacterized protein
MYRISWDEFERLSVDLYKNIKESNKKYDHIVCVARGGLLLGRLLSEMMNLPLAVISAKCDNNKYVVSQDISTFIKIKGNVLLVDDVLEETIEEIEKIIKKNKKVTNIDVAGIFYRQKTKKFVPDFYINEIIESVRVCFPYQVGTLKKHADL